MRILQPIYQRYDIGVLADDNPQAFAEAVVSLLHDPARRAGMMAAARALAEGDLSWERLVDRLEQFYIKLTKEHRTEL
jgi:glycosyltransferase involved in cell wall biosynthesis